MSVWTEQSEKARQERQWEGTGSEGRGRTWFELLPRADWEGVVKDVLGEDTVKELREGVQGGKEVVATCGWGVSVLCSIIYDLRS